MGVYQRKDSKYHWIRFDKDGDGKIPHKPMSTKILVDAPTPAMRARNKAEAELFFFRKVEELRKGIHLVKEKPPITFGAFADWWLENVAVTLKAKDSAASSVRILKAEFGDTQISLITPKPVMEFRAKRRAGKPPQCDKAKTYTNPVCGRSVDRDIEYLYAILKAAIP